MVEYNVAEGFFNNTMGTLHTAQAAMVAGVQNFVLVSTDKAVRPTNIMGCTKRMAELVLQALAREPQPALFRDYGQVRVRNQTRFTMVRFGNVLGSSGSVIPVFREQLKNGGPLTVTHPEITRYFMTIPEAAQLVIQAGSMGEGGGRVRSRHGGAGKDRRTGGKEDSPLRFYCAQRRESQRRYRDCVHAACVPVKSSTRSC